MSKATERVTLRLTPEQRDALQRIVGERDVSDLIRDLLADYCQQRGVAFPMDVQPHGGRRPGAGRKPKEK